MPEVVVVGAGVHGASAAAHLAARGVDVLLLDRAGVATGPTGSSSAICRATYTNPFLAEVARDSMRLMADFPAFTGGGGSGYRPQGLLFVHPLDDLEAVTTTAGRLRSLGIDVEQLSAAEVATRWPQFETDDVGTALFEPMAGCADPVGTTQSLVSMARHHDAEVRLHTAVAAVAVRPGGGVTVLTADRRIDADRVLLATGPWTRPLVATVGVDLPLSVERHVVATNRFGPVPRLPVMVADLVTQTYLTLEHGTPVFCLGSLRSERSADPDGFDFRVADDEAQQLLAGACRRVPALVDASPTGGWASVYDVSPDWMPVVGEVEAGVFVDAGTSGHGFKLAAAWGGHVADLVTGTSTRAELAHFDPHRFASGAWLSAGFGDTRIIG
jgi:sarcosine oxidase subunit beta